MSSIKNKVQLIGNLGDNPRITVLESGKKVANISLATNETYKDANGEKQTSTEWHNLVAWNKTAEILEKFTSKGSEIAIEGKLTTRNYEDKDGNKRSTTEVVISEILLLSSNKTTSES